MVNLDLLDNFWKSLCQENVSQSHCIYLESDRSDFSISG